MKAETPYMETEILLAIMNGNSSRAIAMASDMSVVELNGFIEQIHQLNNLVREVRARKTSWVSNKFDHDEDNLPKG